MSAAILPFRGKLDIAEPVPCPVEARALHDASAIIAAKDKNDDWTARLLLALLETLNSEQLWLLEFRLLGQDLESAATTQALALVQLSSGKNDHRERVKAALARLGRR